MTTAAGPTRKPPAGDKAKGVLAELSTQAKVDKKLNVQFDRALHRLDKTPKIKKPRQRGRPKAGRVVFTQAQINKLPEYGSIADVSRALQIRYTSLQQWIVCGPTPLEFVERMGHKLFRRDVVIKWLTTTKRFLPKV